MTNTFEDFDARLWKIGHKRTRLAEGYDGTVGDDGLIVFTPKRRKVGFPLRALMMLVVAFFVFKAIIVSHIGVGIYDARVDVLGGGSFVEQIGAFLMQTDPITLGVAQWINPLLK